MQRQHMKGNRKYSLSKQVPIQLVTDFQNDFCPTAMSAYKILCQLSKTSTIANHCVDFTHQTLAAGLNRTTQKSICALNCLERMGYIKILTLENEARGQNINTVQLLHMPKEPELRKTA